jgi:hypothetical protein
MVVMMVDNNGDDGGWDNEYIDDNDGDDDGW